MKELTGLSKQFTKISNEAKTLQERMGALYEDMGNILGRYYSIGETKEKSIKEGEYEAFFQSAMKKFGISSPDELDDDKKKEFFNYVDKNYKAEKETD
jgi:DNA anti-recombination protein RmuC